MKSGSLFTGIGGFDLGFAQAGIEPAWQCEIDKAARSVLARRFPGVPCYEDVRNVRSDNVAAVDLICGGFPCQDLSVAGKRAGLAGERSGLWFEFHRVIDELRPQWVVIENVPGLLSSNKGGDFAIVLRGLVECGYGVAWRILDAQYFGVAQRRRRVFIVGSLGDGRAAEILFERDGLFGNPPARRAPGQGVAGTIAGVSNSGGANGPGRDVDSTDTLIIQPQTFDWQAGVAKSKDRTEVMDPPGRTRSLSASRSLAVVSRSLGAHDGRQDLDSMGAFVFESRYARNGRGAPDTIAPPLKAQNSGTGKGDGAPVIAWHGAQVTSAANQGGVYEEMTPTLNGDQRLSIASVAPTLSKESYSPMKSSSGQQVDWAIGTASGVRRLTPTECERLQGFPDGWTDGQSDSARYRQLGNAVAVPVIRWLGERIVEAA